MRKDERMTLVRAVLSDSDIISIVSQNPKRISRILGFCETGDEITQLIGRVFQLFKGNEALLEDVLKVISRVLSNYANNQKTN